MEIIQNENIRELIPSEGMVLTDKLTETMRAEILYLGKGDNPENYKEIDKDTPIEDEDEATIEDYEEALNELGVSE